MIVLMILGIFGILMLSFGVYVRLGRAKVWYITPGIPVVMPQIVQNMLIPLGITFIILAISASPDLVPKLEMRQNLFDYVVVPMFIVTIILGIWNPRWMRPRWLVYLDDTYGPSLTRKMFAIAAKNAHSWSKQVSTQEGLEGWARETCLELGYSLPVDDDERLRQTIRKMLDKEEKNRDIGRDHSG